MDKQTRPSAYEFGDFRVDLLRRVLSLKESGRPLPLSSRAFDILLLFLEHPDDLLDKSALMEAVWPRIVVDENNLNQHISGLRRVLGERPEEHRFIVTVPGRGYRFVAAVHPVTDVSRAPRSVNESLVPPPPEETKDQKSPNAPAGMAAPRADAPPVPPRHGRKVPLGWVGGALTTAALLSASWMTVHYRTASKAAERTSPATAPAAIHSLVVLPLENLSGDKDQDYFAAGMTDALTTDLAQVDSLRVISRTSAMQFKGSKETLPEIGHDLKVDAVVEGAVTRAEDRVRITAQLVEANSDRHLWARSYERDLKNLLALQDEIAQDIAEQIRLKLNPKARSLVSQVHPVDPEAYDAYLRGSYWINQMSRDGFKKGCDYMQKALDKDPSYAPAYVGVSTCTFVPDQAKAAIAKALVLDPSLAEAHSALAEMKFVFDWDWSAEAEYKRAIALNPNSGPTLCRYSQYLLAMGRLDEARRQIERAQDLDPYSIFPTSWLGQVLYHARQYEDALREMRRGLEMHPDSSDFYWDIADVYEQKKMYAEAFAARQQALSLRKDARVSTLGEAYRRAGYTGYLLMQADFEKAHNLLYAAHIYALLNDEPRAIGALEAEAARNARSFSLLFIRTAPELDSIRSSPRFVDLVRRIGFPQVHDDKN